MGGLVLALCLKKYAPDVRFDIYESAPELTEVGAGIGMSPRIWSLIKELGLEEELLTIQGTEGREGTSLFLVLTCRSLNGPRFAKAPPSGSERATSSNRSTSPSSRTVSATFNIE